MNGSIFNLLTIKGKHKFGDWNQKDVKIAEVDFSTLKFWDIFPQVSKTILKPVPIALFDFKELGWIFVNVLTNNKKQIYKYANKLYNFNKKPIYYLVKYKKSLIWYRNFRAILGHSVLGLIFKLNIGRENSSSIFYQKQSIGSIILDQKSGQFSSSKN